MRINCPKCKWEPSSRSRWVCTGGCGYIWNTFDTHGKCPGCSKQWMHTMCPACGQWSLHNDWYHNEVPVTEQLTVEDEILELVAA